MSPATPKEERACPAPSTPIATSRPAWVAGAPTTGKPRRSAGSPSSSSRSGSAARSARRTSTRTRQGRASPAAMDRILDAGFKQPAGESVLIQSRSLTRGRSRLQCGDRGRRRARLQGRRTSSNVRSPLDPGNADQIARTGTRHSSSSRSAATRTRPSTRSAPSSTRSPPRSSPSAASSSASSATRAR